MDEEASKYYKKLSEQSSHLQFLNEFDKELGNSSDRGLVLICGSIIDELLKELLISFLIKAPKTEKELFGISGPLGSFDSKMKMAYYSGLISKIELQNIKLLQGIRNKFAHQISNISFENIDIINTCSNFSIPKNGFLPSIIPLPKKGTNDIPTIDLNPIKKDTESRERFIFIFKYLFMNLITRTYTDPPGNREECIEEYTADIIISLQIKSSKKILEVQKTALFKYNDIKNRYEKLILKAQEQNTETEILFKNLEDVKEVIAELEHNLKLSEKAFSPIIAFQEYTQDVIKNSLSK